jgi:GT2 family glycosyltransferase
MVHVSVNIGTSRPGGLDISLRGMADQTFDDFEIILVDARYHKRHAQVLDYVKQLGIKQPVYHIPNHRFNGFYSVAAEGFNTGFMLSAGDIVIMLLDYAYAPPRWIESHLALHGRKKLVMSPHIYYDLPSEAVFRKDGGHPKVMGHMAGIASNEAQVREILESREGYDEITVFGRQPFEIGMLAKFERSKWPNQDPKLEVPEGPIQHSYMHCKNESFPLETVLDIGGVDEDPAEIYSDNELGFRLSLAGCDLWLTQTAAVHCPNPRGIFPRIARAFDINAVDRETKSRYAQLTEQLKLGISPKSRNHYDLWRKRNELWHWRDLSQEREPLIPRNEMSDEEYKKW